ncbi:MAG: TIGR00366 family protein [Planctomycetes bacterium]|nr:TIGR00366 family protein [Planctomycetota bacterium]
MKKSWFPDSLVLIFALIVVAQFVSYLLPAGRYERVLVGEPGHQREQVVPGSYRVIPEEEREPLPIYAFLTSIPKGMADAADIIFFVFIIGGAIGAMRASGATDALIGAAVKNFSGNPILLVTGMVVLFAAGSSTIGMAEEYMPFIPILVTMCLALRMDAIVAMGIVYVGYGIGYGCAALNPFTVIIAQNISGIEPISGWWFRCILIVPCLAVGIHHLLKYAGRIKTDPKQSLVNDVDFTTGFEMPEDVRFTWRRAAVLTAFACTVVLFIVGIELWDWYLNELAAVFAGLGIVTALLAGMSPNRLAKEFCSGAAELTTAALLIGFARTITVVMNDAMITDTVIHGIADLLEGMPATISAIGMFFVQTLCNFFIPSGSGQAYVTMPLMAPLADLTGVTRQTAVLAYQFGDGFTNIIIPTNALLMGMLGLSRIPYQRWFRFIVPLLIKVYIIAILGLVVAVAIGYS